MDRRAGTDPKQSTLVGARQARMVMAVSTNIGATVRFKWLLFRTLERLSELGSGHGAAQDGNTVAAAPAPPSTCASLPRSLWVYASTIGELNAIEPFLRNLLPEMGAPPLVLITDHPHYRTSFLAKYPTAQVLTLDHRSETAAALAAHHPPRLLIVAEIPCGLSDAPCQFPFAVVYELKRRGVPVCAVNGWLYGHAPSCTMNAIEKRLFGKDYLRLIDVLTVQDSSARQTLIDQGADPERVFVTGNIKYDAISEQDWSPVHAKSPALLESIVAGRRPSIVAGCVTNIAEQILALDAFVAVLKRLPDALMVLAPRHPEVGERMTKLRAMLEERGLRYAFKSETGDAVIPKDVHCLVLDTLGELKDFYAAGDVAYVGLNHNILEPLAFGKPVVVTPGWNPEFPSFPVYRHLLSEGTIRQVEPEALGGAWQDLLADPAKRSSKRQEITRMLKSFKGASARNLELLARFGLLHETG